MAEARKRFRQRIRKPGVPGKLALASGQDLKRDGKKKKKKLLLFELELRKGQDNSAVWQKLSDQVCGGGTLGK